MARRRRKWSEKDHPRHLKGSGDESGRFREAASAPGAAWAGRISDSIGDRQSLTTGLPGGSAGGDWAARMAAQMDPDNARAHAIREELAAGRDVTAPPPPIDVLMRHLAGDDSANLAHLTVTGEGNGNMYTRHVREIPRSQMPQLPETVDRLAPFLAALGERGVSAELVEMDPRELVMTQNELDSKKVGIIYSAIMDGGWREDTVMIASQEQAALDGHHRMAAASAARVAGKDFKMKVLKVDMPIDDLLAFSERFSGAKKGMADQFAA